MSYEEFVKQKKTKEAAYREKCEASANEAYNKGLWDAVKWNPFKWHVFLLNMK